MTVKRTDLLGMGGVFLALAAFLVVTWVAVDVVLVLVFAVLLAVTGLASLVLGLRTPRAAVTHEAAMPSSPASQPVAGAPSRYAPGARVRYEAGDSGTARTQGHEVMLRGHPGTILRSHGAEAFDVRWDAGEYDEYVDLVPTSAGTMRAVTGSPVSLAAFDTPVHEDHLEPGGAPEQGRASRDHEEPAAELTDPGTGSSRRCGSCGREVMSTSRFVRVAASLGYEVDPFTGDSATGPGQALYDDLEAGRGYQCQTCGRLHCTDCLMRTPRHPTTGGPRCPSCAEGPHAPFDD